MLILLAILHIVIGIALIVFVLLQDPKGGAMGVFSGGSSSSSFFGASGASNFLATATKWLGMAFAITCFTLTYITAKRGTSVMDSYTAPVTAPAPATPASDAAGSAPSAVNPAGGAQAPASPTDSSKTQKPAEAPQH